jgi:hypothetical protein
MDKDNVFIAEQVSFTTKEIIVLVFVYHDLYSFDDNLSLKFKNAVLDLLKDGDWDFDVSHRKKSSDEKYSSSAKHVTTTTSLTTFVCELIPNILVEPTVAVNKLKKFLDFEQIDLEVVETIKKVRDKLIILLSSMFKEINKFASRGVEYNHSFSCECVNRNAESYKFNIELIIEKPDLEEKMKEAIETVTILVEKPPKKNEKQKKEQTKNSNKERDRKQKEREAYYKSIGLKIKKK